MHRRIALLVTVLASLVLPAAAHATFPGTNGRILYAGAPDASTLVPYSTVLPSGLGAQRVYVRGRGRAVGDMRFSPNGRSILFDEQVPAGDDFVQRIVRMSSFGRSPVVLQSGSDVAPFYGAWASTGGVWFVRVAMNATTLVGPAGDVTWMYATTNQDCACPKHFAIEPGGQRVAFVREDSRVDPATLDAADSHEVWIADADGTDERKLTSFGNLFGSSEGSPEVRWSSAGYVYFTALVGSDDAVRSVWHRIRPDGTDLVRIAADLRVEGLEPSPNGQWLLLTTETGSVYRTNAAGRTRLLLRGTDAVFSPDSRRIAYAQSFRIAGSLRRQSEIYTMNLAGTSRTRVTSTPTINERPIDWQRAPS